MLKIENQQNNEKREYLTRDKRNVRDSEIWFKIKHENTDKTQIFFNSLFWIIEWHSLS